MTNRVTKTTTKYATATDLLPGQRVDLQADQFATMRGLGTNHDDHENTVSMFSFEYAEVDRVELETPECVVVHTSLTSFGCPPTHRIKLAPDDSQHPWTVGITATCERLGYFATHDEAAEFIGTLPDHLDGRYYLDGPER